MRPGSQLVLQRWQPPLLVIRFFLILARYENTYFLLLIAWLLSCATTQAQTLDYTPALAQTQASTYTDLGSTGTVIATTNTDDANSVAQPIGFSLMFDGTTYTQFILNTNGFIKLGTVAAATAAAFQPYAQLGVGR